MRSTLSAIFDAAVAAVAPNACVPGALPEPIEARTLVAGAGKAAAAMAAALTRNYRAPVSGLVVTRYGHRLPDSQTPGIEVLEAGHPVLDAASLEAGHRILELVRSASAGERIIFLLSGGASALLECPAAGLDIGEVQNVNRALLEAGADISAINCVRKKLSRIKGGRLALAAAPAETVLLAISDVPGDNLADIGSGPFSPDPTTLADARRILEQHKCQVSARLLQALHDPANEPPSGRHAAFELVESRLIARSADALAAAGQLARSAGFEPIMLGETSRVAARALARSHAELALRHLRARQRIALISGGETNVRVMHPGGRGGRNTCYLLCLALSLDGAPGIWALAADTDGIDGTQHNAGALLTPDSLPRAAKLGLDGERLLASDRSFDFFAGLNDLLVTGPTCTNVNDLRVVLIAPDGCG
jgi:hydroxypyruvate reductase